MNVCISTCPFILKIHTSHQNVWGLTLLPFLCHAHLQLQPSQTPLCFYRELLPHLWGHFICSVPCLLPSSASSGHVPRIPSVLAYLPLTLESRGGPLAVLLGSMQLPLPSTVLSTWHPCSCTQVRAVSPPALLWAVPTASGIVSHLAGKCSKLFIKEKRTWKMNRLFWTSKAGWWVIYFLTFSYHKRNVKTLI